MNQAIIMDNVNTETGVYCVESMLAKAAAIDPAIRGTIIEVYEQCIEENPKHIYCDYWIALAMELYAIDFDENDQEHLDMMGLYQDD